MQGLKHAERGTCIECMYYINFMYFSLTPSFLENLVSPPLKIISKKNPAICTYIQYIQYVLICSIYNIHYIQYVHVHTVQYVYNDVYQFVMI